MTGRPAITLRAVIAEIPAECYERSTRKSLLYLVRASLIYATIVAALLAADQPLLLLLLWPLAGLAISGLFVLGHDAAHGALFENPRWNDLAGRIALLPSLHAYSVWILGHNRIHHVHAGRQGYDFVWHPLTPEQYGALDQRHRWLHRLEWSAAGVGLYYLLEVWWKRMVRLQPLPRFAADFRRDRLVVTLYAAAASLLWLAAGWVIYGSIGGALWTWIKVGLMPWLCWNYAIGITVYLQHICAESGWHGDEDWSRYRGQIETTTNYVAPAWYNLFAHNIFLHIPHHVDPRIPFYNLPQANEALQRRFGDDFTTRPLTFLGYLQTTRRCKLYDFASGRWSGYPEQSETS